MRISFYAPMKPPTAIRPSGDRRMARALIAALERAGHDVTLASIFRSRGPAGDPNHQKRLQQVGRRLGNRLIARYTALSDGDKPDLWFTYHVYYKAPDWLGPSVSEALGIPYVIAEASHAPKRAGGPWSIGHDAATAAIRAADRIVGINRANAPCVLPLLDDPARLIPLPPFLDTASFAATQAEKITVGRAPSLITVAMMREGDKLASYRVLRDTLAGLSARPWQISIIGDGPARTKIEAMMAPLGPDRVRFLGQKAPEEMPALLAAADIFVWPAINEAYGMAILEAQAAGIPVIAGDAGGVSEIVEHGATGLLAPMGDASTLSAALDGLLTDPGRRESMAHSAREKVRTQHSLEMAARQLDEIVTLAHQRRAA